MPRVVTGPYGTFHAWQNDIVSTAIASGTFWDGHIKGALDAADPTGTVLDLGANIGFFTVYLARRFARVLAVEAHPETYKLLVKNMAENQIDPDRFALWYGAAYDRKTTLHLAPAEWLGFALPSETNLDLTSSSASVAFAPTGEGLAVPAFPVDPLVQSYQHDGWPSVSLIKVDCQGCDLRALVGLQETITRDRPLIVFEFEGSPSRWHGDAMEDYEAFFAAHHYSVERIREDLWDYVARPNKETADAPT